MKASNRLCIIISGPSFSEALEQIAEASKIADLLEFRLDLFDFSEQHHKIKQLLESTFLPIIFTLRTAAQGGKCFLQEEVWQQKVKELLILGPTYFDIEFDHPMEFFLEISELFPQLLLICSSHDFQNTPSHLDKLLASLLEKPAAIYKLAVLAHHTGDALRLLNFIKSQSQLKGRLVGIAMGEWGRISRILGPFVENAFTYAILDKTQQVAPGQLTANELLNIYQFRNLSPYAELYGLIGDPIEFSQGHIRHNTEYMRRKREAVYIKMKVSKEELPYFLEQASLLGFRGLSVTMPLKEEIKKYLVNTSEIETMGSVNTLLLTPCAIFGYNTDGIAIEEGLTHLSSLKNKKVIILGAGGTAKAAAYHLYKQDTALVILNRSLEKARALASLYDAEFGTIDDFSLFAKNGYDILVNCTSVGFGQGSQCPIACESLLPHRIVLDVVAYPSETLLIREAKKRGCKTVSGIEVFERQAIRQMGLWFSNEL